MRSVRKSWAIIGAGSLALFCTACVTQSRDVTSFAARADHTPALNAMTYFAHGNLLERQGVFKRAVEQYRQALVRQPRFPTAQNRLGITLNKLGRHEEASQVFRDAIDARPEQSHVHNNLGFSLLLEGKLTQAESAIRRSLELNPKFKRARMNHGIILAKLSRFDEAFAEFVLVGSEADAHFNLAMVQSDAGMYDQACDALRRALALRPDMQAAQAHLNRLTSRVKETEIKHAADELLMPEPISLELPNAPDSYSEIAWDSIYDQSPAAALDEAQDVDAGTDDAPTDLRTALDRAFAKRFGDEDDDGERLVSPLDSESERLDRPALPPPTDAPVAMVTIDSETPIGLADSVSFEDPYAEWAAESGPPPVEAAILDVDPLPVEFDPISLAANLMTSLRSFLETVEIDVSEARGVEANMPETVADSDMERADVEISIATAAVEPAEPVLSSEDVQRAIDALLTEAEYLAELLFAIQDDLDPDYAFALTREVDSIISEQLSEVTALDELRCDLLEREMEVEALSNH